MKNKLIPFAGATLIAAALAACGGGTSSLPQTAPDAASRKPAGFYYSPVPCVTSSDGTPVGIGNQIPCQPTWPGVVYSPQPTATPTDTPSPSPSPSPSIVATATPKPMPTPKPTKTPKPKR
jgi:hypothetical protein